MNLRMGYPVNPNITFQVRQSVICLCCYPMSFIHAEAWAERKRVKEYRCRAAENVTGLLI